ncbi:MAG: amidohydrolase family protein [Bacteroidetes bacterium]|nr:amidohydrolase family protein [Bacteroidota bacterium]
MKRLFLLLTLFIIHYPLSILFSQETFPTNGAPDKRHTYYAFTNAKIIIDYQTTIEKGTLLIKDGIIVDAGTTVAIPKGAVAYDLKGKNIYPSLIDIYTTYGMPLPEMKKPGDRMFYRGPQMESNIKGAYGWNQAIHPETEADKIFTKDSKSAEEWRKLGFGAVMSFKKDGIARGSAVFVSLADEKENQIILKEKAAAMYSFDKGTSTQDYPSSQMGSIALLRQTYYDAQWYKSQITNPKSQIEYNISLEAWSKLQTLPQIFEVNDKLSALRADKVCDEFKIQYIIKGAGDEYQRMDEIKNTNAKFILPLKFPMPYDVEDAYDASLISYSDLKHWEMASMNPSAFEKKNIPFALTTDGLKEKNMFWKNLRKAIEYGLSEKEALKALTLSPAEMLGMQNQIGSLKKGMVANFIITSGNLFDEKTSIYENWVQGKQYVIKEKDMPDLRGNYKLEAENKIYNLKISGDAEKPKADISIPVPNSKKDSAKVSAEFSVAGKLVSMNFIFKGDSGTTRFSGNVENENPATIKGKGQLSNGHWVNWTATYLSELPKDTAKKDSTKKEIVKHYPTLDDVIYPFNAYGQKKMAEQLPKAILIKNTTVWTNEPEGILKNQDVILFNGKIINMSGGATIDSATTAKYLVIDGTGKHLTPGIIDEHSHIAISNGVNESAQASSAEVRIGDVIDCDDINIYRNLSGGVVASQLLHGSANPIGGQSGIIKLRWGKSPEEMKIKGADGFIKFALGENVKQSNWGDFNTVRFPQTRMGVEQVYFDYFTRAKEYSSKWKAFGDGMKGNKTTAGIPEIDFLESLIYGSAPQNISSTVAMPRRDLELDAISEILNKKIFITCHSYVQSEINMLMHVGDSMGFRVNTFTHILEGYKVADKMKARGIGASTFSDWWAYKMEVKEAIPYNAALMEKMGIVTAINSDDAEMSRRLNQEAAKSVKYGNLSEEEALKLCTINPAKLLHLDSHMGSIKVGKDADVVLWTDNPLSVYAKVDKTIIDGQIYFDADTDKKLRDDIRTDRARIINLMIQAKKGGEPTQKPEKKEKKEYNCREELENSEY